MPKNELGEAIPSFIRIVGEYLETAQTEALAAEILVRNRQQKVIDRTVADRLVAANDRRMGLRVEVIATGRDLAKRLVEAGHDPANVLRVVHAADGGGGPPAVAAVWLDCKIGLQAIELGTGGESLNAASNTDPWLSAADLAQLFRLTKDVVNGRLTRFRKKDKAQTGWQETGGPTKNSPQFLYKLSVVRPALERHSKKNIVEIPRENPRHPRHSRH